MEILSNTEQIHEKDNRVESAPEQNVEKPY